MEIWRHFSQKAEWLPSLNFIWNFAFTTDFPECPKEWGNFYA